MSIGAVSTLAGTGKKGRQDSAGTTGALFKRPNGVAVDGEGNVIVSDMYNHSIRKICPQGVVSTIAGTGEEGHRDGEGTVARFNCPGGLAVDWDGN
eukprot:2693861-Pyramimonas_sp.AAC.2